MLRDLKKKKVGFIGEEVCRGGEEEGYLLYLSGGSLTVQPDDDDNDDDDDYDDDDDDGHDIGLHDDDDLIMPVPNDCFKDMPNW